MSPPNSKPNHQLQRRDATGHINPTYARQLLARARENRNEDDGPDSARAFLDGSRSDDPLAEELGEAFVEAVTSGEESEAGRRDQVTEDEFGGPFVYTSGREEFALDIDESNIAEATREPLPRTSNAEP
ncbi:MAG TPA: hypothetical protein VFS67_16670 [Polyangiaceae bacterium]|jgi:hypothetical protein|nr:hypothetical protein [Polyangiaceae bacterium]